MFLTILNWLLYISVIGIGFILILTQFIKTKYGLTYDERRYANKTKFCIVGGGVSGICCGYFFKLMGLDFTIIEKGENIGGTWFWNKYPGIGCDVPSHLYSFSFYLIPDWSKSFSPGAEIHQYLSEVWNWAMLPHHTRLNTTVKKAYWNKDEEEWELTLCENGHTETLKYKWVISCIGLLHVPYFPDFKNREVFKGPTWHTTRWNDAVCLKNKKVGIIGNGASTVQILPELLNVCEQVVMFQRTAHFVFPRFQLVFSPAFKKLMSVWPFGLLWRFKEYMIREMRFFMVFNGVEFIEKWLLKVYSQYLKATIKDSGMREKLRPNFKLGCKRILISDEYYSRMNDDNFVLDNSTINKFTENGIKTVDKEHELDIIIFATGFTFIEHAQFLIAENKELEHAWFSTDYGTYFGTFFPGVPNFATLMGPMTGLGHNSIIFMIECQMQLIINVLREMWSKGAQTAVVKDQPVNEFSEEWRRRIDLSIWSPKNCTSYYQRGSPDGRPWGLWFGTTTEYWWRTRSLKSDHFAFST